MYIGLAVSILAVAMLANAQEIVLPITQSEVEAITQTNVTNISTLHTFDEYTKQAVISPDASMIAIARQQGDSDFHVSIIDLATSDTVMNIQGRMDFFRDIVWSPDNTKLAIISIRTTPSGLQETSVKSYSTSEADYMFGNSDSWYTHYFDLTEGIAMKTLLAWNHSSNLFAVAFPNEINIYDGRHDESLVTLEVSNAESIQWSSNGRFIIVEHGDGVINVLGITLVN